MTKGHFDRFFEHMIQEVKETRDCGQKEYAKDENVFEDFHQTSRLLEVSSFSILYTFLNKHMRGIASWIKGHKSQREDVTGRIKDAIVYLFLLWAMVEEQRMLDARDGKLEDESN